MKSAQDSVKEKTSRKESTKKPETEPLIEKEIVEEQKTEVKSEKSKKSKKVDQSDATPVEQTPGMEDMKQMIYLFISRDPDMFVLEMHIEKKVQMAKFQAEIFEELNQYSQIIDPNDRPKTETKELVFDNLRLHMAFDVVYYGLIT